MEAIPKPTDEHTQARRGETTDGHRHEHVDGTQVKLPGGERLAAVPVAPRVPSGDEHGDGQGIDVIREYDAESLLGVVDPALAAEIAALNECLRRIEQVRCATEDAPAGADARQLTNSAPSIEDGRALDPVHTQSTAGENGDQAVRQFGRFEIVRELGRGGLGVVLLARDPVLHRQVALKIPRPEALLTPDLRQRFQREAQAAARLTHPHIVPVYEVGEIGPICFIASAFVEGQSLATWLHERPHPLDARDAAEIVTDLADAMQYAHRQGVLHRDLKPANVLLERSDAIAEGSTASTLMAKISDFGLAKILDLAGNETRTGAILGTPAYMAPEQVKGSHQQIGPAIDVYGLGAILYELLTGRAPFCGDSDAAILAQLVTDDPPAPRRINPKLSRDLEAICLRALERSPTKRYASACDLAADLRRFLAGEPTWARPLGFARRVAKYGHRNPLVVALASVMVVASLLIAGLAGAWVADRVSASHAIATAQAAAAVADGIERQHQYASHIQHAADALQHGNRHEVIDLLVQCRSLAREPVSCGIEWDFLWGQVNRGERTLVGHPQGVSAVRFAPQGDLVASCGKDGRIILWETKNWTKRAELSYAANKDVSVVEFSRDGSLLAAGGDDGRIVVYRVQDLAVIYDEPVIDGRVFDLTWVGDSRQIAVGGDGTVLSIIDPVTHDHRRTVLQVSTEGRPHGFGHPDEISVLAYLPSRQAIVAFLSPPTVHIVDPDSLASIVPSSLVNPLVGVACTISAGPGYFAATSGVGPIDVFDAHDGAVVASLELAGHIQSMRYSESTGMLVAGFREGAIQMIDFQALLRGRPSAGRRLCAHNDRTESLDFSPDGAWLVSGSRDGEIKLWRTSTFIDPVDVPVGGTPAAIEFSPCGRYFALATKSEAGAWQMNLLDARTGVLLWSASVASSPNAVWCANARHFAFSPDGNEIACAEGESVRTLDVLSGQTKATHSLPTNDSPASVAYSPDGRFLNVQWPYTKTLVLDLVLGNKSDQLQGISKNGLGMLRTMHGDVLLDIEPSHNLTLRAPFSREPVATLSGPTEAVSRAVITKDGRFLACGGREGIVYFWDLNTPSLRGKCVGHEAAIRDLVFSPTGHAILSQSDDGTVRLWDLATRAELLRFGSMRQPVISMALHPSGKVLVLGIEREGRYGLQIHHLGPDRDLLEHVDAAAFGGK
jgi:eukaryotic-like serine/threonine-protein kinase